MYATLQLYRTHPPTIGLNLRSGFLCYDRCSSISCAFSECTCVSFLLFIPLRNPIPNGAPFNHMCLFLPSWGRLALRVPYEPRSVVRRHQFLDDHACFTESQCYGTWNGGAVQC